MSQAMNVPGLTARVLQRMADATPAMQQQWLDLTAREFLANGAPLKAALAYRAIATHSQNPEPVRRKYASLALETYLASNDGDSALKFAELISASPDADREFMERAVTIARGQNKLVLAQQFGRQLLALAPDDPSLIMKQLDVELAANDLPAALSLSTRLLALAPNSDHRERLAQIAEWNGMQELALKHWVALALLDPASPAMARALLLSRAREDDCTWLQLSGKATKSRPLTTDEQATVLAVAQRKKSSQLLAGYLQDYLARYPAPGALWLALAETQAGLGDVESALETLRRIPHGLVGPVESARHQAQTLSQAARFDEALDRLRAVGASANGDDSSYWTLFGDLAWERDKRVEALRAYRVVWDGGAAPAQVAERLIDTYEKQADHAHAIRVAREAYRRFKQPRWLLLAMDMASRGERWNELRELLGSTIHNQAQFDQSEMYWLLAAHLANHDGQTARARNAYQRALALNSGSVSTRVALLWFEIDSGQHQALSVRLQEWRTDAVENSAYWGPFATGMLRLKRADEALPWFQRQLQLRPNDPAWSLAYADALAEANRPLSAWRVRRGVYLQLQALATADEQKANRLPKSLRLPYAGLVREFEGNAAAERVLLGLIANGSNDAGVHSLLVETYLSQEKFDSAHASLVRARAEHYKLPTWQYLAVAQARDDRQAIEAILASSESRLSAIDRIGALRKLGRNREALAVAEGASMQPENRNNPALLEASKQLRLQQSKLAGVIAEQRQLGHMDIRRVEINAGVPAGAGRATMRLAENHLKFKAPALALGGIGKEVDFSAMADWPLEQGSARITLGANRRPDDSLFYGHAEWTRRLGARVGLRLDASLNALSEESAPMRAFGKKDRLSAGLTRDFGESEYARVEVAGQRYRTRSDERLASGYRIEGELGKTLFKRDSLLQVRVSGSWEQNRLSPNLPTDLAARLLPGSVTVNEVAPERFGWLGVGGTLFFGDQQGAPGRLHGSVDATLGRQWPDQKFGTSLRFVMGMKLATRDELRFEAFHSNVQGVVGAPASRGIRLSYQHKL
ncbi:MAG: tetratricopeptide repeat protein [Telluria sp.]